MKTFGSRRANIIRKWWPRKTSKKRKYFEQKPKYSGKKAKVPGKTFQVQGTAIAKALNLDPLVPLEEEQKAQVAGMLLPGVKAGEVMVESQAEDWLLWAVKACTRTCSFRSHFNGKPPKSFTQGKS